MIRGRLIIRLFFLLTALSFLFAAQSAHAEEVTFVKEYSYQASEADSKLTARAIALEQVKRLLLEELGTYLISETEVKNFQLTKDKITTLSAGIVMTQILEDKWNGETYYLKARIKADPKEVTSTLDNLRHDMQKGKELEESKKRADEALAEVARLRAELEAVKGDKQKQAEYNAAANVLSAKDWYEKAYALYQSGDKQGSLDAGSKAIELDPKYVYAYIIRGLAYSELGDNIRAIVDYDRAIELNPKYANAYGNRGLAYSNLGDKIRAIADYNKAIELDPKYANAYSNRGVAYAELGDNKRAIADLDRAIELDPKYANAYINRGLAYSNLGDKIRAIADFDRATELDPRYAPAYYNRGRAYSELGDNKKAIADLDRAIELDPKYANAYIIRGVAYYELGDSEKAMSDWKAVARLGDRKVQDWLRKQEIDW
ncbi:MAG: repeat-containing protein YrrB [Deltaproteobacteria bacterium]|nr:repeat-containing protein YrrB [Deltaproteobacteria bacterium]